MTKKSIPETRDELLASIDEKLVSLRHDLASESFSELGRYVVLSAVNLPLKFVVSESGSITDASLARVQTATRFNRTTAYRLAAVVRDGRGDVGQAMTLGAAYALIIDETQKTRDMIADLEGQK